AHLLDHHLQKGDLFHGYFLLHGFELDREVSQDRRLTEHTESLQALPECIDVLRDLADIVNMALGIRAPGNGDPDEVNRCRNLFSVLASAEHGASDFAGADPAVLIDGGAETLCRECIGGD